MLRKLVVAGLVDAQRGWNGGFRLARPAAQITILDVLRVLEGPLALEHCAFGYPRCDASRPCPLHHLRVELQRTLLGWAASSSLASLPPCPPDEPAKPSGG